MFSEVFQELSHPSKSAIISSLKRSNGLPVSQIASEIKMSYMGVKQHCMNLESLGFLESWRVPRKDAGRPEKLYRLTEKCEDLFPSSGNEVSLSLLAEAKSVFGENAPEKLLLNHFHTKKVFFAKKLSKTRSVTERIQKLVGLREREGYFSECTFDKESGLIIKEYHNPLQALFQEYPNAERFELEMIQELLGTEVHKTVKTGNHGQRQIIFEIITLGRG